MELRTPLSSVLKTTKRHLQKLRDMDISTVGDLLGYYPRTYNDFSEFIPISNIRTDQVNTIKGTLSSIASIKSKFGKKILKAKLSDSSGSVELVWFNQKYLQTVLYNGMKLIITGKAKYEFGKTTIVGPEYEQEKADQIHTGRLVPVYPESEFVSSKWLREKIYPLKKTIPKLYQEHLPQNVITDYQLMPLGQAISEIHFPTDNQTLQQARYRLAFDELFLLQLQALQKKWYFKNQNINANIQITKHVDIDKFLKNLPFQLTEAQIRCINDIISDMDSTFPMSRLLQGDVGSGKTIVAATSILNVHKNGFQSALMAPTEILAEQHYQSFKKIFNDHNLTIKFLSGSTKSKDRKETLDQLKSGSIDLIIGTHALIQESITFKKLGLAVIDEQHRFGVEQRSNLKKHGNPHLLSLSATPIPRTLALTIYGDQDLSIIDQMPLGRKPIVTRIVPENKRADAYKWIEDRIMTGRQAFVICPLIDESDNLELKSVLQEYENLLAIFPNLNIGFLHGKMRSEEKEQIMKDFNQNIINILVSTSVIEVGIDVPNASIMLIEGAERFGLSQLHQFRGRVGRGEHQSYCFLFIQNESYNAKKRLQAMVKHTDGFKLSEIDLEMRGPGQIFGLRQSGIPDLKMATLTDSVTINQARGAADKIITIDPELENFQILLNKLNQLTNIEILD